MLNQEQPEGFDTRVHIRDSKTGAISKVQNYRFTRHKGAEIFERDGKFFYSNNEPTTAEEIKKLMPDFPFEKKEVVATESTTSDELRAKKLDVKKLAST